MARKDSAERAAALAGGFATAKKNVVIQFEGRERSEKHILQAVRKDAIAQGIADEEIEDVDIYIKPQEHAIFYVVNKKIEGRIEF